MPRPDPRFEHLLTGLDGRPRGGLLQKAGAIVATLVVFALALTFSVVVFAVVATLGLVVWGYVWWKTRELRRIMRERAQQARADGQHGPQRDGPARGSAAGNIVIEGEVIREVPDDEPPGR